MTARHTLESIQALRAIAAILVVILHSYMHLAARDLVSNDLTTFGVGRAGVDIFFVISGFIMVYVTQNAFQTPGSSNSFIIKRFIRVAPTYWLYTSFIALLLFLSPENFSDGKSFNISHYVTSMLFLPYPTPHDGAIKTILPVGWTLLYEMYFYCVVAILLFFPKRLFLYLLAFWFIGSCILGSIFFADVWQLKVYTHPLLLEFLMGCIIATVYFNRNSIPSPHLWFFFGAALLFVSMFFDTTPKWRVVKWGIPSFFIVIGAIYWERMYSINIPTILARLGASSYSLYLTHLFTINLLGFTWRKVLGLEVHFSVFIVTAVILSIIGGHVCYLLIEQPVTRWLTRAVKKNADKTTSKSLA
ncbi:MAG: acyltransferase [Oceanicoccus sp.]|uniref:acyltransferase family protein n=1 Tax=Oceanicoccus sp. TaxID=2691044 RepID=UPI00262393B2|nr:acyltransferase [Oceanicoccus sp.]MDG1773440.1 acyltransferase [Oceanicoccus sp.]